MENSTKVVTGKVRFCYVNVFEPTVMNEGDTPKYNICILIPKGDAKTLDKINKAIEAVGKENGFIYIFDTASQVILYNSDQSTDAEALVKAKLAAQ